MKSEAQTIVSLFRQQAKATPENIAVVYKDRHYTYAEKNGEVQWLETLGRDGKTEKLIIEEYKEFFGVKTPSKISFVRESETFLELRVRKVNRGKPFGSGTWRLNIPRSYQRIGE